MRDELGLDSGLASRLLRGLEQEGLVATVPHDDDGRRRVARLTRAGQREFRLDRALVEGRSAAAAALANAARQFRCADHARDWAGQIAGLGLPLQFQHPLSVTRHLTMRNGV